MSRLRSVQTLLASIGLLLVVALIGSGTTAATQQNFITALISAIIVYGLYVFVGNSGVISFGQISFVAIGAFSAGLFTIPAQPKHFVLVGLWSFIADHTVSNFASYLIAAGLGALFALIVGLPLMRLSGIAAGIATFAVLEITYNLFLQWTKIGPGPTTLSLVPISVGVWEALLGAVAAAIVAFLYQSSRRGRLLRASREDPAASQAIGVNVTRERWLAFTLSGGLCGLGGALLVHQLGSITVDQVYLELTFLTLAMLVIGGSGSLWGATVGALGISLLDSWLSAAENTVHVVFFSVSLPNGASDLILGVIMAAMLLFRPQGVTGGAEFSLGFVNRLRSRRSRAGVEPSRTGVEGEPKPTLEQDMQPTQGVESRAER
ncbi:MAG TPA: branched-chain amino acid ABC transporter permease [Solirubrobacteraceae bacterium]|nr:branched-chain amino acid ABC transporter permease [Solirubrobacteraceae bacterium]